MRKSSWVILSVIVVLAGVLACHRLSAPLPPDEDQIRALLAAGETAVERRNISSALSCVSKDYSDPAGFNKDGLRLQIIQAFRSAAAFDVAVQTGDIRIAGDSAEVQTEVTLASLQDGDRREVFSGPVTIKLRRESSRRHLFFPTKAWRVAGMAGLPLNPGL